MKLYNIYKYNVLLLLFIFERICNEIILELNLLNLIIILKNHIMQFEIRLVIFNLSF